MKKEQFMKQWKQEEAYAFEGWDFSHIDGRSEEEPLPWDYRETVLSYLKPNLRLLDMGTGGGEFLLTLNHPYSLTSVTEAYPPNIDLCRKRLAPLGIRVTGIVDGADEALPFEDQRFDIVINRHESYDLGEIYRILAPRGVFVTQQVGAANNEDLARVLLGKEQRVSFDHSMKKSVELGETLGFEILFAQEYMPYLRFYDIGALVYLAKIIEWEFPGFSVDACEEQLLKLQGTLMNQGYVESTEHRYMLIMRKRA